MSAVYCGVDFISILCTPVHYHATDYFLKLHMWQSSYTNQSGMCGNNSLVLTCKRPIPLHESLIQVSHYFGCYSLVQGILCLLESLYVGMRWTGL